MSKSIIVDGVEYKPTQAHGQVRIVVLQRGWVIVGRYVRDGENCYLHGASVIRNWGTTKGLGELALEGPKKDTKLDPTNGLVEFHRLTEICTIACEDAKWKAHV